MKLRYALIAFALTLTFLQASAGSQADNIQPKMPVDIENLAMRVGEQFLVVRARILRNSWQPIRMHINDDYEYFGAEKELADRQFLEVDSCSMDAGALCILYYGKGRECLRVDTIGEQLKDMKVTRWTDECPVSKSQNEARALSGGARFAILRLTSPVLTPVTLTAPSAPNARY